MAKKKKAVEINRNKYQEIRKMDHNSLEEYLNDIYERGMAAGLKQNITPTFRGAEALAAIAQIKGIGQEKVKQIRLAMIAAGAVMEGGELAAVMEKHKKLSKYSNYVKLLQENPGIKTICYVDSEIVADDGYGRWQGAVGYAYIQEYITMKLWDPYEKIIEKDDTEELEDWLYNHENMDDAAVAKYLKEIQWERAIFLNVDLPE